MQVMSIRMRDSSPKDLGTLLKNLLKRVLNLLIAKARLAGPDNGEKLAVYAAASLRLISN